MVLSFVTIATNLGSYNITRDDNLIPNVRISADCSLVPDDLPMTWKFVREVAPRIYSRLVMASCEGTTVVHVTSINV